MEKYIVEFENGGKPCWLAGWSGDPGRTVVRENAYRFNSHKKANTALSKAIKENPHRNLEGKIIKITQTDLP